MERQLSEFTDFELELRRYEINISMQEAKVRITLLEAEEQKISLEETKRIAARFVEENQPAEPTPEPEPEPELIEEA